MGQSHQGKDEIQRRKSEGPLTLQPLPTLRSSSYYTVTSDVPDTDVKLGRSPPTWVTGYRTRYCPLRRHLSSRCCVPAATFLKHNQQSRKDLQEAVSHLLRTCSPGSFLGLWSKMQVLGSARHFISKLQLFNYKMG